MKKIITREELKGEKMKEMKYYFFSDERQRVVPIDYLVPLLYYKYLNSVDDIWTFYLENDKLICESIGGMTFVFPLFKTISY
jgi:hypothetical protein